METLDVFVRVGRNGEYRDSRALDGTIARLRITRPPTDLLDLAVVYAAIPLLYGANARDAQTPVLSQLYLGEVPNDTGRGKIKRFSTTPQVGYTAYNLITFADELYEVRSRSWKVNQGDWILRLTDQLQTYRKFNVTPFIEGLADRCFVQLMRARPSFMPALFSGEDADEMPADTWEAVPTSEAMGETATRSRATLPAPVMPVATVPDVPVDDIPEALGERADASRAVHALWAMPVHSNLPDAGPINVKYKVESNQVAEVAPTRGPQPTTQTDILDAVRVMVEHATGENINRSMPTGRLYRDAGHIPARVAGRADFGLNGTRITYSHYGDKLVGNSRVVRGYHPSEHPWHAIHEGAHMRIMGGPIRDEINTLMEDHEALTTAVSDMRLEQRARKRRLAASDARTADIRRLTALSDRTSASIERESAALYQEAADANLAASRRVLDGARATTEAIPPMSEAVRGAVASVTSLSNAVARAAADAATMSHVEEVRSYNLGVSLERSRAAMADTAQATAAALADISGSERARATATEQALDRMNRNLVAVTTGVSKSAEVSEVTSKQIVGLADQFMALTSQNLLSSTEITESLTRLAATIKRVTQAAEPLGLYANSDIPLNAEALPVLERMRERMLTRLNDLGDAMARTVLPAEESNRLGPELASLQRIAENPIRTQNDAIGYLSFSAEALIFADNLARRVEEARAEGDAVLALDQQLVALKSQSSPSTMARTLEVFAALADRDLSDLNKLRRYLIDSKSRRVDVTSYDLRRISAKAQGGIMQMKKTQKEQLLKALESILTK